MRLHIMSDLHLEYSTCEIPETKSDVLVLAGDILAPGHKAIAWAASDKVSRGRPNVQVAGYHEFYGQEFQTERTKIAKTARPMDVHLLDCGWRSFPGLIVVNRLRSADRVRRQYVR